MTFDLAVFVVSLAALLAAARFFTIAAERIGLALGMTPFAVGVLIVSTGTSLPELVSSVIAVAGGTPEIMVGNVLGANLSNLMLVLGAVALLAPRQVRLGEQYILIDLHFLLGSAFLLGLSLKDGVITRPEAGFLIAGYVVYVLYLMKEGHTDADLTVGLGGAAHQMPRRFLALQLAILAVGGIAIYLGARYVVSSLESIAGRLGVATSIVAVTVLSLGTTLPELVVSATAARAGKSDVAVGNILGSCVFNSLAVAGIASLVGRVHASQDLLSLPLPVFGVAALLFYLLTLDKRISRWEGSVFLLAYGLFIMEIARLV
ncbi:MAG TPA: sodium:calcium antiporter [Vicinamibacteria bacterium]|nr:sodium:calcium antiporter [Vicinamibacteria bacterium]